LSREGKCIEDLMRIPGGNKQFGKPRRKGGNNKTDIQEIR
jgi:hypothetical protein